MRCSYITAKVENVYHNFPRSTIIYHHVEKFNKPAIESAIQAAREEGLKLSRNGQKKPSKTEIFSQYFVDFKHPWYLGSHLQKSLYLKLRRIMELHVKEEGEYRFIDEGEGQPLLVLHGLFGALSNFNGVISHFQKTHRVIVPMMPLYDLPLIKTGVGSLADFVAEFMEFKGLKDVILLGNSLGGHVGLVLTKRRPELIKAMILTGSSGLYENAFGGSFPRREDKEYIRKKIAVTFYDPEIVTDELVDVTFELVQDRTRLIKVLALAKSAIRHNMRKDLANYTMPVCLIWGKNDTITPPDVADEFQEKLPDSELFWIDKCGHAPMMEHPEEFNKILDGWLAKRF